MTKRFFTGASAKAAAGIRNVFEAEGYRVIAMVQSNGKVTVVAIKHTDA